MEDEKYIILNAKLTKNLRDALFNSLKLENNNFENFTEEEKLVHLLNPTTPKHIEMIASFTYSH